MIYTWSECTRYIFHRKEQNRMDEWIIILGLYWIFFYAGCAREEEIR